jgi:hypothetical protein
MKHCHDCHRVIELHDALLHEATKLEEIVKDITHGRIYLAIDELELKARKLREQHLKITGRD